MSDRVANSFEPTGIGAPEIYRRSGKVSPISLVVAAAILIPLGILAGAIYSAAVVYLPFMKLRGLVTFFAGAGMGLVAGRLCYTLKYRSGLLATLTILGFTSIAYYSSWAVHPALVIGKGELGDGFLSVLISGFDPRLIWGWVTYVFKEGIWGMGNNGNALSGWAVAAIWAIEAGLIYAMSFITGMGALGNRPFCENCYRWNDETEDLAVLPVATTDPAWQEIRRGNFDALKRLQIVSNQNSSYVELRLADCPTCDESDFLSAIGITLTMDDGELKKKETDIFRNLSVTRDQRNEIVAFAAAMDEALQEMNEAEDDADDQSQPLAGPLSDPTTTDPTDDSTGVADGPNA